MNTTTVTTPNELEIRVERIFDAPRTHVYSVWTDPQLIPEWWGDGTEVEEMDVRPGGTYRFRTAYGVVEGEFREVEPPERLVQTFQNHLQTLEFGAPSHKPRAKVPPPTTRSACPARRSRRPRSEVTTHKGPSASSASRTISSSA